MQDEISHLKVKADYLEDGSRRLHGLYDKSREQIKNLQNKLDTCENYNEGILRIQSNSQICERKIEGMDQTYSFKMIVSII